MDYYANEWMGIREDAYKTIREMQEKPLEQFLEEEDLHDKFFFEYHNINRGLTIYTKNPGIWIGFNGRRAERLKEILKEYFEHDVDIEFKELKGSFMSR